MIISHAGRFIILAPWKTASTTVRARLGAYDEGRHPLLHHFDPHIGHVVHQHLTCAEYLCLPESRLGYVCAALVRNPYDRVYSGFIQLQRDQRALPQLRFREPWIADLVGRQAAELGAQLEGAGFDINRWVALLRDEQILNPGGNTSLPLHPAHYWTHVAGGQVVDFIGRVETFETDFAALCARIGVDPPAARNENVSGGLETRGPGGYRHTAALSGETIARINHLFSADFDLFGYERLAGG